MKLVVLGANGRTGSQVLRVALERHMDVTAVTRSPDRVPAIRHQRLKVVIGDPCDPTFLKKIFQGQDALISTLGSRSPTKKATSVYHQSAEAIVEAAWETGLRRVLVISTALLFREQNLMGKALRLLVPNVVKSATRMEQIFRFSKLDWTSARPGFLTDAKTAAYRAMNEAPLPDGTSVSRRALAEFLVDAVQNSDTHGATFGVSNRLPGSSEGLVNVCA